MGPSVALQQLSTHLVLCYENSSCYFPETVAKTQFIGLFYKNKLHLNIWKPFKIYIIYTNTAFANFHLSSFNHLNRTLGVKSLVNFCLVQFLSAAVQHQCDGNNKKAEQNSKPNMSPDNKKSPSREHTTSSDQLFGALSFSGSYIK